MISVRCDVEGDASAERGLGDVTLVPRREARCDGCALRQWRRTQSPNAPPSFSFPTFPTLGKSTRPAANISRVMSLSRWTDGRAGGCS